MLNLRLDEGNEKVFLKKVIVNFTPCSKPECIAYLSVVYNGTDNLLFCIAQILSDMDAEVEVLEKKLEKYKKMKQGMMQELLTGRIRLKKNV